MQVKQGVVLLAAPLILLLLLAATTTSVSGVNTHDDICKLFSNGTVIRDPYFCQQYIKCIDFKSNYMSCAKATPYYDISTTKCVAKLDNYTTCHDIACEDHADHFLADPAMCEGYYYCQDESESLKSTCPNNMHFEAKSERCIYESSSDCSSDRTLDYCSFVPKKTNFQKEGTTDGYLSCDAKGALTSATCKKTEDYNAATGKCETSVCGSHKTPFANKFVEDPTSCPGYYYCAKKTTGRDEHPTWGKCPTDTFFSAAKEACVNPLEVYCSADRCEGRTLEFVLSGEYGCRNYLLCQNGKTAYTQSCGNLFFSEQYGVCQSQVIAHPACTKK